MHQNAHILPAPARQRLAARTRSAAGKLLRQPLTQAGAVLGLLQPPNGYIKLFRNRIHLYVAGRATAIESTGNFSHPRMLLGEFDQAAIALRIALQQAYGLLPRLARPSLIIQPMELTDGGLSATEKYLLQQLGRSVGARHSHVWIGPDLSEDDVAAFVF